MLLVALSLHGVIDATADTEMIAEKTAIFVKFFAPWCSHCQMMQPAFEELSDSFGEDPEDMDQVAVTIAMVDCTRNMEYCQQQNIGGYPTLALFKQGVRIANYEGDRSFEDMNKFIRQQLGMKIAEEKEQEPIDATDSFHTVIQTGYSLVRFFAPWCGHCVQMKPVYRKLTAEMEGVAQIAEVDCTRTTLCNQMGIRAYPTIFLYNAGKQLREFQGHPTLSAMKQFIEKVIEDDRVLNEIQVRDAGKTVKDSKGFVFAKFFAPWCSHCVEMLPEYKRLIHEMKDQPIDIVEVDCTKQGQFCQNLGIRGYPSLKLFNDGVEVAEFQGHRVADHMKQFLLQQMAQLKQTEESSVVDMNAGFYDFIKTKSVFAAFCIEGHQTCQFLKPAFAKLSALMKDTELVLGWVDCQKARRICSEQNVQQYPKVLLYENGQEKASYLGQINENDMRMWLLVNADEV